MELFPHNELAYSKLKESLVNNQRACVVQPTGTGKSFIIAKFLSDNPDKKFLCITSNNYIIKQFDNNFKKLFSNYDFVIYSTLISRQFNALLKNDYDYIVFDEFHRGGAEEWGNSIEVLLDTHDKSKVVGFTATHIRNDVGEDGFTRNMADELFFGNIVHHLSLREAFDIGILPAPTYIKTLYDLGVEYQNIIDKIEKSNVKNKLHLKKYALEKKLDWDNSNGVEKVLKKYITKERNFIVFCKDVEHLETMLERVEGWFITAFSRKVNIFKVYSYLSESSSQLEEYIYCTNNKKNEFNLLFAVQQLNEGLHTPNTDGVLFLRPTDSPIIYYQQLGRCLETKGNKPLVFDMVNNFKVGSIHQKFVEEIDKEKSEYSYLKSNYSEYKFDFKVIDEVGDYRELFLEIDLSTWEDDYGSFKFSLEQKGWDGLSRKEKTWFYRQRSLFRRNLLNKQRVNKLNELIPLLEYDWKEDGYIKFWKINFSKFEKLLKEKGWDGLLEKEKRWLKHQKTAFKRNKLTKTQINILDGLLPFIPYNWKEDVKPIYWENNYLEFKSLLEQKGWEGLSRKEKDWLRSKKNSFKKGLLSKEKIKLLDELNPYIPFNWRGSFVFDLWMDNYNTFKNKIQQTDWLQLNIDDKRWFYNQVAHFNKGIIDDERVMLLNQLIPYLGFDWKVGKYSKKAT